MNQSTIDGDILFKDYKELMKSNSISYNNLIKQPSMKQLLLDLKNKIILDIGYTLGINYIDFIKIGVAKVVDIIILKKCLT